MTASLFPCSPVIRGCSWKKTQIEQKNISPDIKNDVFPFNTSSIYYIRNIKTFYSIHVKPIYKGTMSVLYFSSKIRKKIPGKYEINSLASFLQNNKK